MIFFLSFHDFFVLRNYAFKKIISIIIHKNKWREIFLSLKKIIKEIGKVFFEK